MNWKKIGKDMLFGLCFVILLWIMIICFCSCSTIDKSVVHYQVITNAEGCEMYEYYNYKYQLVTVFHSPTCSNPIHKKKIRYFLQYEKSI